MEHQEQVTLCRWLDKRKVCHAAVPNAGLRTKRAGARMKAEGLKTGFPDLLIFDPPPALEGRGVVGIAIELKRRSGGSLGPLQQVWLDKLKVRGWHTLVAHGCQEAIKALRELGYDIAP